MSTNSWNWTENGQKAYPYPCALYLGIVVCIYTDISGSGNTNRSQSARTRFLPRWTADPIKISHHPISYSMASHQIQKLVTKHENELRESPEWRAAGSPPVKFVFDEVPPWAIHKQLTARQTSTQPRDISQATRVFSGQSKHSSFNSFHGLKLVPAPPSDDPSPSSPTSSVPQPFTANPDSQHPPATPSEMLSFLAALPSEETADVEYQVQLNEGIRHWSQKQLTDYRADKGDQFNPRRIKRIMKKIGNEWSMVWSAPESRNRW